MSKDELSKATFRKRVGRFRLHTAHPNLRTDYFHRIDTKEKAYWLGFLCADGCLIRHPRTIQIQIKLRRGDEQTIDRF